MAKYIKRDATARMLSEWAFEVMPATMADTLLKAAEAVDKMTAIDIVRCKECKHRFQYHHANGEDYWELRKSSCWHGN